MNNPPIVPNQPPGIEIPDGVEPVYSNLVRIAHSPSELLFDFAHMLPGVATARMRARIVMSPLGAKLLFHALAENLARYEASFGEIKMPGAAADGSLADSLFRPPES